jgi:conjugal transfer pilus assembly protein TraE
MLKKFLDNNITQVIKQRNSFLLFGLGMFITNVILASSILMQSEKIILVPPQIDKTVWLRGTEVSEEYLEEMSIFLIDLLLDQTPSNSAYKRDMLLKYVDSSQYNVILQRLLEQEEYMREHEVSTDFSPISIKVDAGKKEAVIEGELITFVADKKVSNEKTSYLLSFEVKGTKLYLSGFKQEKNNNE